MLKNLVKLNIGLIKFLRVELKRKRTPKQVVEFLFNLSKGYLKESLNLYKELFVILDPKVRAEKKKYDAYMRIKKDLENAVKLLDYIEKKKLSGKSKLEQRQFYHDFMKFGKVRTELYKELMQ